MRLNVYSHHTQKFHRDPQSGLNFQLPQRQLIFEFIEVTGRLVPMDVVFKYNHFLSC